MNLEDQPANNYYRHDATLPPNHLLPPTGREQGVLPVGGVVEHW
jgi:hypothetical protein